MDLSIKEKYRQIIRYIYIVVTKIIYDSILKRVHNYPKLTSLNERFLRRICLHITPVWILYVNTIYLRNLWWIIIINVYLCKQLYRFIRVNIWECHLKVKIKISVVVYKRNKVKQIDATPIFRNLRFRTCLLCKIRTRT